MLWRSTKYKIKANNRFLRLTPPKQIIVVHKIRFYISIVNYLVYFFRGKMLRSDTGYSFSCHLNIITGTEISSIFTNSTDIASRNWFQHPDTIPINLVIKHELYRLFHLLFSFSRKTQHEESSYVYVIFL